MRSIAFASTRGHESIFIGIVFGHGGRLYAESSRTTMHEQELTADQNQLSILNANSSGNIP